jgi:bis(5'-adenosyl)-triphosphatase
VACPFCPPAVAAASFAASGLSRAFCNLRPILPGHSLIVPKRHVARLDALTEDEVADLFRFARRVTRLLRRELGGSGADWTLQDGAAARQTVDHLHLHVIPRAERDLPSPGDWWQRLEASRRAPPDSAARPALTDRDLHALAERLRGAWAIDSSH